MTDFFVDPNGDDSNDGASGSPFRTIKHGLTFLKPGDTWSWPVGPTSSRS